MNVRKLIIEDVRCFSGRQEFNIRPLTFLVGENSTGKSTALGCLHMLYDFIQGRNSGLDFNVKPYQMGAFSDIVRRSKPRRTNFTIGFEIQTKEKESVEYSLILAAKERGSEPTILEQKVRTGNGEISFHEIDKMADGSDTQVGFYDNFETVENTEIDGYRKTTVKMEKYRLDTTVLAMFSPISAVKYMTRKWESLSQSVEEKHIPFTNKDKVRNNFFMELAHLFGENLSNHFSSKWFNPSEVYSFAPIRSKPQRTYDPFKEDVSTKGSDIPMVLMNLSRTDQESWQKLRGRLIGFGRSSGLFSDIQVRRLGKSLGDPFQLQIKVNGPKANLIDVGYGVNQILPILVRIFNGSRNKVFLMQQPEVHLHPKGQAELSSLLIETVKQQKHRYVIETHSDAMINRARIEIMNGRISPNDVSLLYLEPSGNSVRVHNIGFDKQANLLEVPQGYRDFFMNESDRLLGFSN